MNKLVIVGAGEFGEMAYHYFSEDSSYEVVAFAEEQKYRSRETLLGLPVVTYESINEIYPPDQFLLFVAITHVEQNQVRERIFCDAKSQGYSFANYISSRSYVSKTAELGENVFIFENATVQHRVHIETGSVIWCGVCVSHSSRIGSFSWIAPNATIPGFCRIGSHSFVGAGSSMVDNVAIAEMTLVGAGAVVTKDITESNGVYVGNPAKKIRETSPRKCEKTQ